MSDTLSPLQQMRALRQAIEARLLETEDFRAYQALTRAISEMEAARPKQGDVFKQGAPVRNAFAGIVDQRTAERLSQADAAAAALKQAGQPLHIADLLPLVRQWGATVAGNEPSVNLSSSLSRDNRFRSLRLSGRHFWWLANEAIPPEFGGSTEEEEASLDI